MAGHQTYWFVGYVRSCQEKKVAESLGKMGIVHYLPIQKVKRKWSDRIKVVDKVVIKGMIFIYTTEVIRRALLDDIYGLCGYMVKRGTREPIHIPEDQMEAFRFVVSNSVNEVSVSTETFAPGDRVRIKEGPLAGLECDLVSVNGRNTLQVKVGLLGTAYAELPACSVVKITKTEAE